MKLVLIFALFALASAAQFRSFKKKANSTACTQSKLDPFDCYVESGKGKKYVGLMKSSNSGRACRNWLEQGKYSPTTPGIGNHNYCRNPNGDKDKPWCYVKDPNKDWEYCEVPVCKAVGKAPKPWKAPKGSKSDDAESDGPCEYTPPEKPPYEKYEEDRACMDNRGDKVWLIGNKKFEVDDEDGCIGKCKALPGSEYFTYFGSKNDDGKNCGCYRECILVDKDLTTGSPNVYRIGL